MKDTNQTQSTKESLPESQPLDILLLLKISILFFSIAAFFKHYLNSTDLYEIFTDKLLVAPFVLLMFLCLYGIWSIVVKQSTNPSLLYRFCNIGFFFSICAITIWMTGAYESQYKYLLLLVILATIIESGMIAGLVVSGIAGVYLIILDFMVECQGTINYYFENDVVLICFFFVITYIFGQYVMQKKKRILNLELLANMDELTNLYNYRYFMEKLEEAIQKGKETATFLNVLMIDIDHFKQYNDAIGRKHGDIVLKALSNILRHYIVPPHLSARYGGEEFAVLFYGMSENESMAIAEKIRYEFEHTDFFGKECMPHEQLTISIGVSSFSEIAQDRYALLKQCDDALYRAKFLRRNRVEKYVSFLEEFSKYTCELDDDSFIATAKTLLTLINSKDQYTYMHIDRVVEYCTEFSKYQQLEESQSKKLIFSAYLHDIGKIEISREVLCKQEKLTKEEWEELKTHSAVGARIVNTTPHLQEIASIILQHHERYDGKGYPNGKKGNEIHPIARILSVVDCFDAMTAERPYTIAKTVKEACEELIRCAGTQFDPEIVQLFVAFMQEKKYSL